MARQWTDWRLAVVVFLGLLPALVATAAWQFPYNVDALTNVFSAAAIAERGSPLLPDQAALATPQALGVLAWVVDSPRGPVSQYPPGTALFAAPLFLLAGDGQIVELAGSNDPSLAGVSVRVPPLWPAALAAAVATAAAAAALAVAVHSLVGANWALGTAVVATAGTGLWLNGAHELWQHGVATMWIALGLAALAFTRGRTAGVAHGLAILTRPTVTVVAGVVGLLSLTRSRSWRPAANYGIGVVLGLGALLAYNHWLWGELTISGGYSSSFTDQLREAGLVWYGQNLLGALVSPSRGLLVWSPFVAVAALGLPRVWRTLPDWVTASCIGGVVLFLLQFRMNRYSGGTGFFSYRYPLEALMAAAPALSVGGRAVFERGGHWRRALLYSIVWAVLIHLVALVMEVRT